MIRQIVCVRDRAADAYGQPMFVPSLGVGIRSFSDEVNRKDAQNQLWNHADDFDLYHVGAFDDNNCTFQLLERPKMIAVGKDVKVSQ